MRWAVPLLLLPAVPGAQAALSAAADHAKQAPGGARPRVAGRQKLEHRAQIPERIRPRHSVGLRPVELLRRYPRPADKSGGSDITTIREVELE